MVRIIVAPIIPHLLDVDEIVDEIEKQFDKEAEQIERMYKKIVRTWNHNVPFITEKKILKGSLEISVRADDSVKGGKVFRYVDEGTSVRHAVMGAGFRPKTRVRKIGSWAGSGRAVKVSRNINMPGIKAREFTPEIADRRKSPFNFNMRRAINRGIRRAF